ncbi:GNAT family N-acetyltransferase [Chitinophaga alhagiae]|uniref:GNAT family N-acetyltransferase n=1 Tax=Chitinophaga alhagiae TaxID=2203219 RepID=UPI000E5BAB0B|nr:GNAT family protein [Chitinophaga alhagiae]
MQQLLTDVVLEDEAALLRPLTTEDLPLLLPFALREPALWQYSMSPAAGEENMAAYIQQAVDARRAGKEYPFIVFDKKQQAWAGSTRYYDIQPAHATLQLGYTWYGKNFQGTGLNKHCKFLLLQYAFETLGVERVEFRADHTNQKSIAAMKSIGCTVEGVLRSNLVKHDGKRRSSIVLSILKEEWLGGVKERLQAKLR